ncbi:hypothetical protein ACOTFF_15780 [Achromobacter xylosoxidans]
MTSLAQRYVEDLRSALAGASGDFPAAVENSPMRAISREDPKVVSVQLGAESIQELLSPRVTRVREIHLIVHTCGDDHLQLAEEVFEAAQPIVMGYSGPNMVSIVEFGTDEPKYANGDLRRQVVTKRYRITYQTDEHSLGA